MDAGAKELDYGVSMAGEKNLEVKALMPIERIEQHIYLMRGQKVMLSSDLAVLYGVEARRLNEAVSRNRDRFPPDFMFQLSDEEMANLKSQTATSSWGGSRRANPYAFTEQGIAMLSAVLHSPTAIAVSIQIMRAFVRLRQLIATHADLRARLEELERKMAQTDQRFGVVFDAIRQLMEPPEARPKRRIGFIASKER